MTGEKIGRRPRVHDRDALAYASVQGGRVGMRWGRHRWNTQSVELLHPREVRRRLRLIFQNAAHEIRFVADLERPVRAKLVAEGALRNGAKGLATGRPGAMAWPDLQIVGQVAQCLERSEQLDGRTLHRARNAGRTLEQIGPTDVAREEEVTRHHPDGEVARRLVRCEEHDVLGGVPGGVPDGEAHATERDRVTVVQRSRERSTETVSRRCFDPLRGVKERGAGRDGERLGPREEVSVHVGFRDELDPHVLELGGFQIPGRVAERVDHDRLPCRLAGDQVAGLGEPVVIESPEDHRGV